MGPILSTEIKGLPQPPPHPLLFFLPVSRPTADPDPGRATAEFQTPDALIRDEACWMTFQRGSGLFVWAVNRRLINQVGGQTQSSEVLLIELRMFTPSKAATIS